MSETTAVIVWEIDWREPLHAFAPLAGQRHAHLLHSGAHSSEGEWSIIVAFPTTVFSAPKEGPAEDVFAVLQAKIDAHALQAPEGHSAFPFVSGLIGFVGYEAARFIEPSLRLPASPFALPDMSFGYYEAAALFSHASRRAYVVGRNSHACMRLKKALGQYAVVPRTPPAFHGASSNFSVERYQNAVQEAIENILDGDYYQANLSHQISVSAESPFQSADLFRLLISKSDAGFASLLQYPQGDIISNSPERFFRVSVSPSGERRIVTEPVKGTRPRSADREEDAALAAELINDPKDRAENIMIADLMRNDLSRICDDRSIQEEAICELRSYANVHHLVSRISGCLKHDVGFSDIFFALFPCGSITGAPKIAAMEAIARIEAIGRGPYCGAIGYIDDRGGADFSVAIRTMTTSIDRKKLFASVGGGVTLNSDPYKEYLETLDKSKDSLAAIGASIGDAL